MRKDHLWDAYYRNSVSTRQHGTEEPSLMFAGTESSLSFLFPYSCRPVGLIFEFFNRISFYFLIFLVCLGVWEPFSLCVYLSVCRRAHWLSNGVLWGGEMESAARSGPPLLNLRSQTAVASRQQPRPNFWHSSPGSSRLLPPHFSSQRSLWKADGATSQPPHQTQVRNKTTSLNQSSVFVRERTYGTCSLKVSVLELNPLKYIESDVLFC